MINLNKIKNVVRVFYYKSKVPLSILKTFLIQRFKYLKPKNKALSESKHSKYPELALKAAINKKTFQVFRRHHEYAYILDNVGKNQAQKFFNIIHDEYKLSEKEIIEIIEPLQYCGSPRHYAINGLSKRVSSLALSYLKIALDIKKLKGVNLGNVVEIGCGFGGQAIILDQICKIESYTFLDIWQVNMLIRRFIEFSDFRPNYYVSTIREYYPRLDNFDMAISNYGFCELPINWQNIYFDKILSKSNNGYMIFNGRKDGGCFDIDMNMSQKELSLRIPNCKFYDERPLTSPEGYLMTW